MNRYNQIYSYDFFPMEQTKYLLNNFNIYYSGISQQSLNHDDKCKLPQLMLPAIEGTSTSSFSTNEFSKHFVPILQAILQHNQLLHVRLINFINIFLLIFRIFPPKWLWAFPVPFPSIALGRANPWPIILFKLNNFAMFSSISIVVIHPLHQAQK
jgi:hypothetical protein